MDAQKRAIDHMNADHSDIVCVFCEVFGKFENPTNVLMTAINEDGMEISCDQGKIFVPFLQKANVNGEGFRNEIIALYSKIKSEQRAAAKGGAHPHAVGHGHGTGAHPHGSGHPGGEKKESKAQESMMALVDSLKSLIISSVDANGDCVSSYAPFVKEGEDIFFCVSSVSQHYHTIKANPSKVSVMFIEDEKDARTILARHRLSSKCEINFVENETKRDEIFDKLQAKNPNDGSFEDIKGMKDFYIVKAVLKKGRYVKGFGAAYDVDGLEITKGLQDSDPHTKR